MGLFRGAVFCHGGRARKQPIKQLTEMPTSTMALMGRFHSLMGRFPTLMGHFPDFALRGRFTSWKFTGKQPIKKRGVKRFLIFCVAGEKSQRCLGPNSVSSPPRKPCHSSSRRKIASDCGSFCYFCEEENVGTSDFQSEVGEVFGEIGGELPAKFGRRFSSFLCWENRQKHFPPKLHRKFHHETSLKGSGLWRALKTSPLRFGWRRGSLRQKIAAICDCDF